MSLERLSPGHVVAAAAAIVLLFVMALDWYGTVFADDLRRLLDGVEVDGQDSGTPGREFEERAVPRAEELETNAWQARGVLSRMILFSLIFTAVGALAAAASRVIGRPARPAGLLTLAAALISLILIVIRLIDQPGLDEAATIRAGPILAIPLLLIAAYAASMGLRAERAGATAEEPSEEPSPAAGEGEGGGAAAAGSPLSADS